MTIREENYDRKQVATRLRNREEHRETMLKRERQEAQTRLNDASRQATRSDSR